MIRAFVRSEVPIAVNFSAARSGLTNVGYTLLNADQEIIQERTTEGVREVLLNGEGTGVYTAVLPARDEAYSGYVLWDSGQDPEAEDELQRLITEIEPIQISLPTIPVLMIKMTVRRAPVSNQITPRPSSKQTISMYRHDVLPKLRIELFDQNDAPLNLQDVASVKINIGSDAANLIVHNANCQILDVQRGICEYAWKPEDTTTPGEYDGEVVITFSSGEVVTAGRFLYRLLDSLH